MEQNHQGNYLLRRLSAGELERAGLAREYALRDVLLTEDEVPRFLYFPHPGSVASIVRTTASGQMIEAGVIGAEGVLNVHTILSAPAPTGSRAIVQNEGAFTAIGTELLKTLFNDNAIFRQALLSFTSLFLDQVTQNLLCNRLHLVEERLAKWLLLMRDRVGKRELHMTQEFLSYMLGVHRPSISLAVNQLADEGLISHSRGRIEVLDLERTRERSCECYVPLQGKLAKFIADFA